MWVPWCRFGKLTDLLWSHGKSSFPCKFKMWPFQIHFQQCVEGAGAPDLTVTLYPVWTCPDTSSSRDSPILKWLVGWLSALWVGSILPMMLTDLKFEPFQTPQQTKQHKLKSSPFTDVNPTAVFDRLCFIFSRLILFSLSYTLKCSVSFCQVNELWSLVKVSFIVKRFRQCTES